MSSKTNEKFPANVVDKEWGGVSLPWKSLERDKTEPSWQFTRLRRKEPNLIWYFNEFLFDEQWSCKQFENHLINPFPPCYFRAFFPAEKTFPAEAKLRPRTSEKQKIISLIEQRKKIVLETLSSTTAWNFVANKSTFANSVGSQFSEPIKRSK